MNTFLLTWNPSLGSDDLKSEVREFKKKGYANSGWSTGSRNHGIAPGDRFFMLRQGPDRAGIVGMGEILSEITQGNPWNPLKPEKDANYVRIRYNSLLDVETNEFLDRRKLNAGVLADVNWNTQTSGIIIEAHAARRLEVMWSRFLARLGRSIPSLTGRSTEIQTYLEGAPKDQITTRYERDPRARAKCIEHYGYQCSVCGFDFEAKYGKLGSRFIQVHHLVPRSKIGRESQTDPVKDLRPICPNCHAMIHRLSPPLSIKGLQHRLAAAQKR